VTRPTRRERRGRRGEGAGGARRRRDDEHASDPRRDPVVAETRDAEDDARSDETRHDIDVEDGKTPGRGVSTRADE
jgi:hypothetical protein